MFLLYQKMTDEAFIVHFLLIKKEILLLMSVFMHINVVTHIAVCSLCLFSLLKLLKIIMMLQ